MKDRASLSQNSLDNPLSDNKNALSIDTNTEFKNTIIITIRRKGTSTPTPEQLKHLQSQKEVKND